MISSHTIIKNIEAITESPQRNPAVWRCCQAAIRALEESQEENPDAYTDIAEAAITAYCDATPSLDGSENIRDYVACVTHAMLLGVIDPSDGPKFLYAAQIALGVLPREPKNPVGRPPKAEN